MDIQKQDLKSGLYIVATPIGNLRDITLRALDVLASADVIYCEDTRVSRKLLSHYGIKSKLFSYNDHNADQKRAQIIDTIEDGMTVALISDAGMPLISDPGYKLVRDCLAQDIYVTTLPGANAPLSAVQLSGLPSDNFTFLGFLPAKKGERDKVLKTWADVSSTLVAFETSKRLLKTLAAIDDVYGARILSVVREITKLHEEVRQGNAQDLLSYYEEHGAPRGEIVLVIEGADKNADVTQADIESLLMEALKTMSKKDAVALVTQKTGAPRKVVYKMALQLDA